MLFYKTPFFVVWLRIAVPYSTLNALYGSAFGRKWFWVLAGSVQQPRCHTCSVVYMLVKKSSIGKQFNLHSCSFHQSEGLRITTGIPKNIGPYSINFSQPRKLYIVPYAQGELASSLLMAWAFCYGGILFALLDPNVLFAPGKLRRWFPSLFQASSYWKVAWIRPLWLCFRLYIQYSSLQAGGALNTSTVQF